MKEKIINNIQLIIAFLTRHKAAVLLFLVLIISAAITGINILEYPYYESDEGTYTSQAWSVITQNKLSPYTYWYDHPPFGWLTLAAWYSILPGGIFTFGTSIDTGRVLMLILHLFSTFFVFYITRKITKSPIAAFLSAFLFTVTPLGIYFHRRVLLDNMLTFWLLFSVAILYRSRLTLREYLLSGLFYSFAFLTKVTTAMAGPAILFFVLSLKDRTHKLFRATTWLTTSILVTFIYILFAMIKNELVPSLDPENEHVSLLGSLMFQMERGNGLKFYQAGSDFLQVVRDWLLRDTAFVYGSLLVIILGIVFSFVKREINTRFITLIIVLNLFFLMRGGIVINFYVLPILPFVCILVPIVILDSMKCIHSWLERIPERYKKLNFKYLMVFRKINQKTFAKYSLLTFTLVTVAYYGFFSDMKYLHANETANQKHAIEWIKNTLPAQADIVIDAIMLVELRDPNYINSKSFENAEWFYKVSRDPQITLDKYNNSWRTLDYVAITHEMLKQIDQFEDSDIVHQAYDNSLPIAKWFEGSSSYIDEQRLITTNGDWAMIYEINGNTKSQLVSSWDFYKKNFIVSYGQSVDPAGDITTSEGQSYAMLRAAWMNDKEMFKGSWLWTQHHLQHRLDDKLISWKWGNDQLLDSANATDADLDIALALLFGSKIFQDDQYLEDAKEIIRDLWDHSVVEVNGTYYLVSSNKSQAQVPGGLLINPSYMSPAHYRLFSQVDPEHDWLKLADDTYKLLNEIADQNFTQLPANWYVLNTTTGALSSANQYVNASASDYGYDAFRIIWRVRLDSDWFDSVQANDYLTRVSSYLVTRTNGEIRLPTTMNPQTGNPILWEDSIAIQTGYVLALASHSDKSIATKYYENFIANTYDEEGYWGYEDRYYDQNWVWFMSAIYNNDVYNLWEAF